nr:hypothetical protein [Paracidovorax oryzae]
MLRLEMLRLRIFEDGLDGIHLLAGHLCDGLRIIEPSLSQFLMMPKVTVNQQIADGLIVNDGGQNNRGFGRATNHGACVREQAALGEENGGLKRCKYAAVKGGRNQLLRAELIGLHIGQNAHAQDVERRGSVKPRHKVRADIGYLTREAGGQEAFVL